MVTITPEQRQEIEKAGNLPVKIEDPANHRQYVLISVELYDRIRSRVDVEHIGRSLYEYGDFRPLKK